MDDFYRRESRLTGELFAAGLAPWTHPSTGERGIQTRQEWWSDIQRLRDDVRALCADATRAKPDHHLRLRTSRSARPPTHRD